MDQKHSHHHSDAVDDLKNIEVVSVSPSFESNADENEEDDDDTSWGILGGEDDWEVADFHKGINAKYPGWFLIKMPEYSSQGFIEVKNWLADGNVTFGKYEPVGWTSGCSYSVGVVFESAKDAMIFKLRWR
jgi:hypothetical protein